MKKLANCLALVVSFFFLFGCGGGSGSGEKSSLVQEDPVVAPAPEGTQVPVDSEFPGQAPVENNDAIQNFTTTVTPIVSKPVSAASGGMVQMQTPSQAIVKLTIPPGSLVQDTVITGATVDNPPTLPIGLNFVGQTYDFGPDGTTFNGTGTVEIPFTDKDLQAAGVGSKSALKLYVFDKSTKQWSQEKISYIDTTKNVVAGEVKHFSFYSLVGINGTPPSDMGRPQPGDLLFKLSLNSDGVLAGWVPGHVGIYIGEKEWNGKGLATEFVRFFGKYNVVESMGGVGVRYAYYDIPDVPESYKISAKFEGSSVYMGAREPLNFTLTQEQRTKIVEYVEKQIGKPYLDLGVNFGLTFGNNVKGPDLFNCVGLAEKAYEVAGVNGGQGLLLNDGYDLITPAQLYAQTRASGEKAPLPVINWATLTPQQGTSKTIMFAQIAVSHPYGLDYIDSVIYMTDNGFMNPNVFINDKGLNGDLKAGDGIYSASAQVGEYPNRVAGFNFIVTDKSGKSVTVRREFTYTTTTAPYAEVF